MLREQQARLFTWFGALMEQPDPQWMRLQAGGDGGKPDLLDAATLTSRLQAAQLRLHLARDVGLSEPSWVQLL